MNPYIKNLKKIEFVVTMACTGTCKHCSEGDHDGFTEHIDKTVAAEAVRKICSYYDISTVMTFGGEPLLYPDTVCAIHKTATSLGVAKRQVITNGFFSRNKVRIKTVALSLAESGVNALLLSVDAFHQETIPLDPVMVFAECAVDAGIPIKLQPAWLVSPVDQNPYNEKTKEIIRAFESLHIPLNQGNVIFPSGNALKYLREYFDDDAAPFSPYEEDPEDIKTISFDPNGDVLNGNVYQTDILEIIRTYRPYTTARNPTYSGLSTCSRERARSADKFPRTPSDDPVDSRHDETASVPGIRRRVDISIYQGRKDV